MELMPDGRAERARAKTTALELLDGPLEHCDTGPRKRARVDDYPVALGLDSEPVLEPAHHHGDHGPHVVDPQTLSLAALQPALDGLSGRDGLRDRERDRGVDVDAPVGRLLHDAHADRRR